MIGELIGDFVVNVTLRRRVASTFVKGRVVDAAPVSSTIPVVVVPASGRDLLRLPEGSRTQETKRILAQVALLVEPMPDEIVYRGIVYEVRTCADFEDQGGFFDALAIKKVRQTEGTHASTLGAATQVATGTETIEGSQAATLAGATQVASGTVT